jgi:GNAT superfamily N-acetyltransferase
MLTPESPAIPDVRFAREPADRHLLVDRFYRAQGYKVKVASPESVFTLSYLEAPGKTPEIVAAARFVPQSSGDYWLRNLLVGKAWRGRGLASSLMVSALSLIAPHGCYCFALPHLRSFYLKLGFDVEPADCPTDIRQKFDQYQARGRDWLLMGYRERG